MPTSWLRMVLSVGGIAPALRGGATFAFVTLALGCNGGAFKEAVHTWTAGGGYTGAVQRVLEDEELDDSSRRIELMSLSGLACTLDEDRGASTDQGQTPACKCAKPITGGDQQLQDCKAWAGALSGS